MCSAMTGSVPDCCEGTYRLASASMTEPPVEHEGVVLDGRLYVSTETTEIA